MHPKNLHKNTNSNTQQAAHTSHRVTGKQKEPRKIIFLPSGKLCLGLQPFPGIGAAQGTEPGDRHITRTHCFSLYMAKLLKKSLEMVPSMVAHFHTVLRFQQKAYPASLLSSCTTVVNWTVLCLCNRELCSRIPGITRQWFMYARQCGRMIVTQDYI